ncbi:DUF309 domain-containing protein [Mycobacterium koreense]|uniref:Uncharacterized protein n=1 Tax=Mycolicibacillus koreensis TaxID=1069220 RepID=A0A7I7SDZ5_9MYCO|nr:DUF309 domain-containing protein [Mycolicibacillus koreensis]MCV7248210.1 DUF309 domain-containing protein [Mycolicibacillus koreensis]OSC33827.1 hypothetical protein B8W67_09070 [Mycolicibacillus koreensis]BBY55147.1 hypothetical protein MKOR_23980 [Mycolicibacillus koreensis]
MFERDRSERDPAERDRDESGRPRNARPRDALGRPLPRGSRGVPTVPEDLQLPPPESLAYAQRLLDEGRAFHAHEVLEAAWKTGPDDERMLWQGLAQLAVGITHIQRGNRTGAAALLRRGAGRLGAATPRHDVDVAGLIGFAERLAERVDAGAAIPATQLRPRLVSRPAPTQS